MPEDHWGVKEISAAAAYGWIEADEDGNFHPTEIITRGEACTIMNRVLGRDSSANDFTTFPDVPETHPASRDVNEATGR